jgi:hypothetical protein
MLTPLSRALYVPRLVTSECCVFLLDFSGVTMTMERKLGEIVEPFDQKDVLELGERFLEILLYIIGQSARRIW